MVARETLVEQSVQEFIKTQLFDVRGYPHDQVAVVDDFNPDKVGQPLEKNLVAMGFHFDEGGQQAELGSDLKSRVYVIEMFTFAKTMIWGKNLSSTVRDAADVLGTIPLLDFGQESKPEIDKLIVLLAHARREPIADPQPWEEYVFTTTLQVQDFYHASLV